MNRIDRKFAELKQRGKKALIIFVTAGDPDLKTTERLIPELFKAGADIVEIGVPFSDPLADGPTIQASFLRAMKSEINMDKIFNMVGRIRKKCHDPILIMSAYNLIYRYGTRKFSNHAKQNGVDGVIFPDLIPDESGETVADLKRNDIAPVFLAAPTSGKDRVRKVTAASGGFIYYITVTGITGKQKPSEVDVRRQVSMIKRFTNLPVACGFGISTPRQAASIGKIADGVIVGSAIVKLLAESGSRQTRLKEVVKLTRKLRKALT
ncbi:MAG: tryptophan synthase subunit alpha [Nitrospinota bacterium]